MQQNTIKWKWKLDFPRFIGSKRYHSYDNDTCIKQFYMLGIVKFWKRYWLMSTRFMHLSTALLLFSFSSKQSIILRSRFVLHSKIIGEWGAIAHQSKSGAFGKILLFTNINKNCIDLHIKHQQLSFCHLEEILVLLLDINYHFKFNLTQVRV